MQETQETQFDPRVGKIPWSRKWQPTPVFLPGRFMDRGAWRTIVYDFAELDMIEYAHTHTQLLAYKDPSLSY